MAFETALRSVGSNKLTLSATSSTRIPPAPITSAGPNCSSRLTPMMSSATAPVIMRSTRY